MSIEPLSDYDFLPRYVRVADDLRVKLGSPGFEAGTFLPGEHELSTAYQVSRGTVRKALDILQQERLISKQPGRGTIILPPKVKPIKQRYTVAVIWNIIRWLELDTLNALEKTLTESNCDMRFASSQHQAARESELLHKVLDDKPDGLVLYPTGAHENAVLIENIMQHIPVVLVHHYPIDLKAQASTVTTTNKESVQELCQHMIELGHQNIAFVLWTGKSILVNSQLEREAGYLQAMRESALTPLVLKSASAQQVSKESFASTLITFIERHHPSALIFHNDASAYRMYPYLKQHGFRIPEDISIAGFDGLAFEFDLAEFSLSTVAQPFEALGTEAGLLIRELLKHPTKPPQHVRLPARLQAGNTVRRITTESA